MITIYQVFGCRWMLLLNGKPWEVFGSEAEARQCADELLGLSA